MASSTIDLNFTASSSGDSSNKELINSLNNLSNRLNSLDAIIVKFSQSAENFRRAAEVPEKIQQARLYNSTASLLRAQNIATPESIEAKARSTEARLINSEARLKREEENAKYRKLATESYQSGDEKGARLFAGLVGNSLKKGIEDGTKKGLQDIIKVAGVASSAVFISSTLSKNYALSAQMSNAAMANPFLNYNYGSQVSDLMNIGAQRSATNLTALSSVLGGALGFLSPFPGGMAAGAGIGGAIGGFLGAQGTAEAQIRGTALGELINQQSTSAALSQTNKSAYNVLKLSGFQSYDRSSELDPMAVFEKEAARGAAVYNQNFKAVNDLTKYFIAAQIPVGQVAKISSTIAQIFPNLTKNQLSGLASYASTAGVDIGAFSDRTLQFVQGGLGVDAAQKVAAQSFQNVSGFQSYISSMNQGSFLTPTKLQMMAKLLPVPFDFIKMMHGDKGEQDKYQANLRMGQQHLGNMRYAPMQSMLDYMGSSLSMINPSTYGARDFTQAGITPTTMQQHFNDLVKNTRLGALKGNFSSDAIAKEISSIAGISSSLDKASESSNSFVQALQQGAIAISNFTASFGGYGFGFPGLGITSPVTAASSASKIPPPPLTVVKHIKGGNSASHKNNSGLGSD